MRPITLLRADMTPVIDCQLFAGGIDKAVSKFISKKINSFSSLWNGLLSSSKKIGSSSLLYELKYALIIHLKDIKFVSTNVFYFEIYRNGVMDKNCYQTW